MQDNQSPQATGKSQTCLLMKLMCAQRKNLESHLRGFSQGISFDLPSHPYRCPFPIGPALPKQCYSQTLPQALAAGRSHSTNISLQDV